ncbi:unnamed protein product [Angiostrongylus costaricensis]|uniref:Secreted protein n=1 Tax=Angiostrongylus costaricensis TaxID=334426 RepID=A0A0R3PQW8_ANGCS|nr:unnamed protein product [Angiostrongylus costaricensis]
MAFNLKFAMIALLIHHSITASACAPTAIVEQNEGEGGKSDDSAEVNKSELRKMCSARFPEGMPNYGRDHHRSLHLHLHHYHHPRYVMWSGFRIRSYGRVIKLIKDRIASETACQLVDT